MIPKIDFCNAEYFEQVKSKIDEFELDNRELKAEEFLVIKNREGLLGFGRVREHADFSEMCSMGIIEAKRFSGLGKQLAQALIEKATQPLYLVCIIPEYFETLGFSICKDFPIALQDKLDYCTHSLPVDEKYVVMRKN